MQVLEPRSSSHQCGPTAKASQAALQAALAPIAQMPKRLVSRQARLGHHRWGAQTGKASSHFLPVSKLSERLVRVLRSCPLGSERPAGLLSSCFPTASCGWVRFACGFCGCCSVAGAGRCCRGSLEGLTLVLLTALFATAAKLLRWRGDGRSRVGSRPGLSPVGMASGIQDVEGKTARNNSTVYGCVAATGHVICTGFSEQCEQDRDMSKMRASTQLATSSPGFSSGAALVSSACRRMDSSSSSAPVRSASMNCRVGN